MSCFQGEYAAELIATAQKLSTPGKGVLAADESTGTIGGDGAEAMPLLACTSVKHASCPVACQRCGDPTTSVAVRVPRHP